MKIRGDFFTSIEQSKHLLDLGLNPETADMCWGIDDDTMKYNNNPYPLPWKDYTAKDFYLPCWSLAALMDVMPTGCNLSTPKLMNALPYCCWNQDTEFYGRTSIGAAIAMINWLIENNKMCEETRAKGEQKTNDKVEPKFKIGDRIVEKELDECGSGTIVNIKDGKYIFDDGCFIRITEQERWQLVEQKPIDKVEPKFKVGDCIYDKRDSYNRNVIREVGKDYYINAFGQKMDMAYTNTNFEFLKHLEDDNVDSKPAAWSEEDEKLRKEMLQIAKESEDSFYMVLTPNKRETLIAWLEKQSEPQVRTGSEWVKTIDDACEHRYAEEYAHGEYCHQQSFRWGFQEGVDWLEKQGEQNPKFADFIPTDCTSDAKNGNRWHKVADSLPDNGREVLCKDAIGNFFIGRYYNDGDYWEVSMYDEPDKSNEDNPPVIMWANIPSCEQNSSNKVEPKFKVGDKIKLAKEPKYPAREIIAIKNDAYYFDMLVHLPFSHQDEWELVGQMPTDKVEPKFKVGDWIVYKNDICQIVKREEGCNKLVTKFGIEKELVNERNLSTARFWTIQDAKDGDILANDCSIIIFRNIGNNTWDDVIDYYVGYSKTLSIFKIQSGKSHYGRANETSFKPATKEQRDLLFQKMKEAGYEWDSEKKELKKIEQKPAEWEYSFGKNTTVDNLIGIAECLEMDGDCSFNGMSGTDCGKFLRELARRETVEQNPAWSEEDENRVDQICEDLKCGLINFYANKNVKGLHFDKIIESNIDWLKNKLKSLRPQNNVSDEELIKARNEAYNDALDKLEYHSDTPTFNDGWSAAIGYLKKKNAQPQNIWKPSDEQMEIIHKYAEQNNYDGSVLTSLYRDLKKLREE